MLAACSLATYDKFPSIPSSSSSSQAIHTQHISIYSGMQRKEEDFGGVIFCFLSPHPHPPFFACLFDLVAWPASYPVTAASQASNQRRI